MVYGSGDVNRGIKRPENCIPMPRKFLFNCFHIYYLKINKTNSSRGGKQIHAKRRFHSNQRVFCFVQISYSRQKWQQQKQRT